MLDIPAGVCCHSQKQHNPPEHEDGSHPNFVSGESQFFWQKARARSQQNVQSGDLGNASECCVRCRQRVVSLAKLGRNPGKHVDLKRRNHRQSDRDKVKKHDDGLAPGVLPKPPNASEPSTNEQPHSHGDFQDQNQVGRVRGRCSKEPFVQRIISALTTAAGLFMPRSESCVAARAGLTLAIRTKILTSLNEYRSGTRSNALSGRPTPRSLIGTECCDETSQSPPYAFAVELSSPPMAGHDANSFHDVRPFSNAFGSFLLSRITLCTFGLPPS